MFTWTYIYINPYRSTSCVPTLPNEKYVWNDAGTSLNPNRHESSETFSRW